MAFDAEGRPDDTDESVRNFPIEGVVSTGGSLSLDPARAHAEDRAFRVGHRTITPDGPDNADDGGSPTDTDAGVERVPWDAFGGITLDSDAYAALSGGCNSEIKALTLGSLAANEPLTAFQLHERVMGSQGETPAWPTLRVGTVQGYCETFASAGLVEARHGNPDAYTLSQNGVRSLPRVGNLLGLSLMESPPLFAYFGPSRRLGEDPVWISERRVGVLRVLRDIDGEQISTTTVARRLGGHENNITTIVDDLALYGLLSASSTGRSGARVKYRTTERILEHTATTNFGSDVLSILVTHHHEHPTQPFTNRDVVDQLLTMGYTDEPTFIIKVASRIAQLASKHGALDATRSHEQTGVSSVVSATQEQLRGIDSLFRALGHGYTHTNYEAEGLTTLQVIRTEPEFVNHLLTKARTTSTALKSRPDAQDQALRTIGQVLQTMDGPLTTREVWELLQTEGLRFDPDTVDRKLHTLVQLGKVGIQSGQNGIKHTYVWLK